MVSAALLALVPNEDVTMATLHPVRPAAVAGQFYPGSSENLSMEVDQMLSNATFDESIRGDILALVAPHAGYMYSGEVAAVAYRSVQGKRYDAVIVIAPSHRDGFSGVSIMAHGAYQTPLGQVPIHQDIAGKILQYDADVHDSQLGHGTEHAVEVQLPFIQRAVGDVPIVPIVMLDRTWSICRRLAEALSQAVEGYHVLVVASSDLYHGYSEAECEAVDSFTLAAAQLGSAEQFCSDLAADRAQACGGGPIAVVKEYARLCGATRATVLSRANSAAATGQHGGYVVGYGAVAFHGEAAMGNSQSLSGEDRALLLKIARESVRSAVMGLPLPTPPTGRPALEEPKGAFVTIRQLGELRGCIGQLQAFEPLAMTVILMAKAAALNDPRFERMSASDLNTATLEISVLSPFEQVSSPTEIEVGKHGLYITGRGRRGVLLPQVATEQGWSRDTFLDHVCLKAGLPKNTWRSGDVVVERFTAEIVEDDSPIGRGDEPRL